MNDLSPDPAPPSAAEQQLARECEAIGKAQAEGHITAAEAAGMLDVARARCRLAVELAAIDHDYPPWHAWQGTLPHLLYARRPNSSPPIVVRAPSVSGLRAAVEGAEARLRTG